jgi:hypothetical protein
MAYAGVHRGIMPRLWRPRDLGASLCLWLDAADPTTLSLSGVNVTAWADKSGSGNSVSQGTTADQPTLATVGANKYVTFAGSPHLLVGNLSVPTNFPLGNANRTIVAVVNPSSSITTGTILQYGNGASTGATGGGVLLFQAAANNLDFSTNNYDVKTSAAVVATPQIITATYTGVQWAAIETYVPSGGPVSASAAPGSIGNGWSDINGSKWSIDSSNNLTQVLTSTNPYATAELIRTNSADELVDSQIAVTYTPSAGGPSIILIARAKTVTAGNLEAYLASFGSNGSINFYTCNGGTGITSLASTASGTALTAGTQYIASLQVIQTGSTLTTLIATVTTTAGVIVNTLTTTDTNSTLLNATGGQGVCFNGTGGTAGSIQKIVTYTDVGSTPSGHVTINGGTSNSVTGPTITTTANTSALHVGAAYWTATTQLYYIGGINSIIVVNGDSSAQTTAKCEGYLAWQAGFQNLLPSSHPYRYFPPKYAG